LDVFGSEITSKVNMARWSNVRQQQEEKMVDYTGESR